MGVQLIARNTTAPWNTKVAPPITRGLEGWFTLDTDARRFGFNRAPGKPDATIVGAPSAFAGYGRFKGNVNYLQTQIADSDEMTLIVVGKATNPLVAGVDSVFLAGAHLGPVSTPGFTGNASGVNLYLDHPTLFKGSGSRDSGAGTANASAVSGTATATNAWAIRSIRAKSAAATLLMDHTAGVKVTGTDLNARVLTSNKYRIGSATAGFTGDSDISFVAIHSAYLTDSELEAQIVPIRKRLARLGIVA
ncbi:hypothetical protein HU764_008710 [Pseudomonas sp. SWRI100]|uniref:hypothetical protein n=1 Tax=Pseudomonas TaxID=286 RepID=UPI001647CB4B|nr:MULTISPECIES: hypothetical protein [Pseudomonas]MBC3496761.1 hypothetical protein [Pseudomonas sp. SWRI67]MBV4526178.1 hypothetical protein [Pseudomonas kermanshahensis]